MKTNSEISIQSNLDVLSKEDKNELIRVLSSTDEGYYPMLSGNKYRYAIRFTLFTPTMQGSASVDSKVSFKLACC